MRLRIMMSKQARLSNPDAARELTELELARVEGGVKDTLCTHELTRLPSGRAIPTPWDLAPPHEPFPSSPTTLPF